MAKCQDRWSIELERVMMINLMKHFTHSLPDTIFAHLIKKNRKAKRLRSLTFLFRLTTTKKPNQKRPSWMTKRKQPRTINYQPLSPTHHHHHQLYHLVIFYEKTSASELAGYQWMNRTNHHPLSKQTNWQIGSYQLKIKCFML